MLQALAESGKACCISSYNKWVINSGAIDHMIGNPKTFSSFQSDKVPFLVTIADGSNYSIVGCGTIRPTSFITLSPIVSLPQLACNMICMCKLTKGLNNCVSFFLGHCLLQDLMMKQIIGEGHVSNGLYIFDAWVPRSVACAGGISPFETHRCLWHPSLPTLK